MIVISLKSLILKARMRAVCCVHHLSLRLDAQHGYSTDLQYVCSAKQPGPPLPPSHLGQLIRWQLVIILTMADAVPGINKPADVQTMVDSLASTVSHGYNVIDLAFINFKPDAAAGNKVDDSGINPVVKCDSRRPKAVGRLCRLH